MKEKLDLLSYARDFEVVKISNDTYNEYEVTAKNGGIKAFISEDGDIEYYVTGCYNSGDDDIWIDIEELQKLKEFCELLIKE